MDTPEDNLGEHEPAWDDLSWEEKADRIMTELDPSYVPVDAETQRSAPTELSYCQKQILGGTAISGKFA